MVNLQLLPGVRWCLLSHFGPCNESSNFIFPFKYVYVRYNAQKFKGYPLAESDSECLARKLPAPKETHSQVQT